jgi:formate dehydrogenase beta subunit
MWALIVMGTLGVIIGIGLALASKIFYVYVDPMILAVDDALPGANCGGCGYPGCTSNAEAIVDGKSAPNSCVAGSAELAEIIAGLLGVSVEAKEPDIALPGCTYGLDEADVKYQYSGINDCRAASLLGGGMKVCNVGCLGLGTCASACMFGAITMGEEGLPVVDEKNVRDAARASGFARNISLHYRLLRGGSSANTPRMTAQRHAREHVLPVLIFGSISIRFQRGIMADRFRL